MDSYGLVLERIKKHIQFAEELMNDCWGGYALDKSSLCLGEARQRCREMQAIAAKYDLKDLSSELPILIESLEEKAEGYTGQPNAANIMGYLYDEIAKVARRLSSQVEDQRLAKLLSASVLTEDEEISVEVQREGRFYREVRSGSSAPQRSVIENQNVRDLICASLRLGKDESEFNIEAWTAAAFGLDGRSRTPKALFNKAKLSRLFKLLYQESRSEVKKYSLQPYVKIVEKL